VSNVLHVPQLGSNLLSLYHLTQKKGYEISIKASSICFYHNNELHLTATITNHNVGYLDGPIIIPQEAQTVHSTLYSSTCPLDLTLWYCCCSHVNFTDLKYMLLNKKVTGMAIKSISSLDPICEPCIMGKQ
jgi:hypothetical protein